MCIKVALMKKKKQQQKIGPQVEQLCKSFVTLLNCMQFLFLKKIVLFYMLLGGKANDRGRGMSHEAYHVK